MTQYSAEDMDAIKAYVKKTRWKALLFALIATLVAPIIFLLISEAISKTNHHQQVQLLNASGIELMDMHQELATLKKDPTLALGDDFFSSHTSIHIQRLEREVAFHQLEHRLLVFRMAQYRLHMVYGSATIAVLAFLFVFFLCHNTAKKAPLTPQDQTRYRRGQLGVALFFAVGICLIHLPSPVIKHLLGFGPSPLQSVSWGVEQAQAEVDALIDETPKTLTPLPGT